MIRLSFLAILLFPSQLRSQDCKKVTLADFPKKDLPTAADRQHLKKEASHIYYYGIGVPVKYTKVRQLAFLELERSGAQENTFEACSVLIMLYANGLGVSRNLDLCIRMACANIGGAGAEVEGRVQHLKDLKASGSKERFDICDDITSGYMSGWCTSLHSELGDIDRKANLKKLIKSWSQKDQAAYTRLAKIAGSFINARVLGEVDMSGTARAAMENEESDAQENNFFAKLEQADSCSFPSYTTEDFIKADKELNRIYGKIMKDKDFHFGTVTQKDIRSTQLEWIKYKDALVIFGATKCPQTTESSLKTLLTNERIAELKDFTDED